MSHRAFIIASRFDPTRSPLGRLVRARAADARQGESLYIVAVALIVLAFVLAGFLGWTVLPEPQPPGARIFIVLGGVLLVVFASTCLVGRQPEIVIRPGRSDLTVESSDGALRIHYSVVERVSRIDDRTYYRHYRRYAETRDFVNRIPPELLLVRAAGIPVVFGLDSDADLDALESLLARTPVTGRASSHVDAA